MPAPTLMTSDADHISPEINQLRSKIDKARNLCIDQVDYLRAVLEGIQRALEGSPDTLGGALKAVVSKDRWSNFITLSSDDREMNVLKNFETLAKKLPPWLIDSSDEEILLNIPPKKTVQAIRELAKQHFGKYDSQIDRFLVPRVGSDSYDSVLNVLETSLNKEQPSNPRGLFNQVLTLSYFLRDLRVAIEHMKSALSNKKLLKRLEDPDDVFGRIAFAPNRDDQFAAPFLEPNTDEESMAYEALRGHFAGNDSYFNRNTVSVLKGILRDKKYADIIKPPAKSMTLYRGMAVSRAWMRKTLGTAKFDARDEYPRKGRLRVNFEFNPADGTLISSWSRFAKIASKFAHKRTHWDDRPYAIVIKAKASQNPESFIMGDRGLYRLSRIKKWSDEHEVVGMGTIDVFEIDFIDTAYID